MKPAGSLEFKIACENAEFELIHRLNYRTFVEEIPQHQPARTKLLVDQFHEENTYAICLHGDELVGMIAVRGNRPFSLDHKLANLDAWLPPGRTICELRLLAVEKGYRNGRVLLGLLELVAQNCIRQGYDLAVISAAVQQQKLYRHLGFVPFGPLVGTEEALFQPMCLTLEDFQRGSNVVSRSLRSPSHAAAPLSFAPGPVDLYPEVVQAFAGTLLSHRSETFVSDFQLVRELLRELVGARNVIILLGSGTLANDAIASQLSLLDKRGLILCNGEFGRRLVDHARRFGLAFEVLEAPWGEAFDPEEIGLASDRTQDIGWLWAVHCETSTGVLNELNTLKQICAERGINLCLDCISSIATVPVDLRDIYLASGVSGKGLGAYPGLSMVFYNHEIAPAAKALPRYLDLGLYASKRGIPFTHSSNLIYALRAALLRLAQQDNPFSDLLALSVELRSKLREHGFEIVASDAHASPAVVTIELPVEISSAGVGRQLKEKGYSLSYRSEYLLKRNWIQVCLMGRCSREKLALVLEELQRFAPTRVSALQGSPSGKR